MASLCAHCGERPRIGFRLYAAVTAVMLGMGALGGVVFAYTFGSAVNADLQRHFDTKDAMRDRCIDGNDRACKLFEVEYAR